MRKSISFAIVVMFWISFVYCVASDTSISLERRWWGEHELAWRLAEQANLRWAITDGIAGRGIVGGTDTTLDNVAAEFYSGTGIKLEVIGGILVAHRPNQTGLQEFAAIIKHGGDPAVKAAWQLGHLQDARAWPILATAVAGNNEELALSAAHALRRLDGEEDFDIRRWVTGSGIYDSKSPRDAGFTQIPLGACFKDVLTAADLHQLASSKYVPLREAAARLATGCIEGKAIVEKLTKDPVLLVRKVAERSLQVWQEPVPARARPLLKPDIKEAWELTLKDEIGSRKFAPLIAAFGTPEDIRQLIEVSLTNKSDHIRMQAYKALMDQAGGDELVAHFLMEADKGNPWPDRNHYRQVHQAKLALASLLDGGKLAYELGPRLGTDGWMVASEFLLARYSGAQALPYLEKVYDKRGFVAPLAVGYAGGPAAVTSLAPLLQSDDLSTAIAAARGLGESGQLSAIPHLIDALSNSNRVLRSRVALALGRIGGSVAIKALATLLKTEADYLPRRSACTMLRELNGDDPAYRKLIADTEAALSAYIPSYNPQNKLFGDDFPTCKLEQMGKVFTVASLGETRCMVDQFSGVWVRYGGCDPCYSNEVIGYDVASGKWFVIRPNETDGLFYNEKRAGRGCSRGMAFDPNTRAFFVNNSTGFPTEMYPGRYACYYDLTTDRFEGTFPDSRLELREGPKWYVTDTRRGHIYTEWMGPKTTVIESSTRQLLDLQIEGLPRLHEYYVFEAAGYDPVGDTLLRQVVQHRKREKQPADDFGLWLIDLKNGQARKSRNSLPGKRGSGQGLQIVFDNLNRELVLMRTDGAYIYDRINDDWQKVMDGDCSMLVFDYDPQHNVFLGLKPIGRFMAFRLKNVPHGTQAFYGWPSQK